MKAKTKKRLLFIFGLLLITGLLAKYLLLDLSSIPDISNYDLDLDRVRELALADMDNLPIRINSLLVARGHFPGWLVMAGGSSGGYPTDWRTFQVVYDLETIIIDPVHDRAMHEEFAFGKEYFEDGFEATQLALREASLILVTHEHWDHVGGISKSPHIGDIWEKVILTREQVLSTTIDHAGFEEGLLESYGALEYDKYHRIAPGMVLIKSPGHTPGHQMIFVTLRDGAEYLFLGDIVWNMDNIRKEAGHSILVSFLAREDRVQMANQIRTLYDISQTQLIHLVVAHDSEQHEQYIQEGVIGNRLEVD